MEGGVSVVRMSNRHTSLVHSWDVGQEAKIEIEAYKPREEHILIKETPRLLTQNRTTPMSDTGMPIPQPSLPGDLWTRMD